MTDLTDLRYLDRAVAEAKCWCGGMRIPLGEAGLRTSIACPVCDFGEPIPRYSTDWAAAGPLLEEMAAAAIEPEVIHCGHDWLVSTHPYDESPAVCGHAVGLPEAIARAYVEWKAATADEQERHNPKCKHGIDFGCIEGLCYSLPTH